MRRVRVKICGITRRMDAQAAARAGVDAIGLVFYQKSPRFVSVEQAREICTGLPPFVTVVGLFVNPSRAYVETVCQAIPVSLLQFHGDESPVFCEGFYRPWLKAVRVRCAEDVVTAEQDYAQAAGLLLDAWQPGLYGGTGLTFDWSCLPPETGQPRILAGGLTAENVSEAIRLVQPYGVDVSGGVESQKGIKSHEKMTAFMREVAHESRI